MLGGMKVIKMLGLTGVIETLIRKAREIELDTSKEFRKLLVWQVLLGMCSPLAYCSFRWRR